MNKTLFFPENILEKLDAHVHLSDSDSPDSAGKFVQLHHNS